MKNSQNTGPSVPIPTNRQLTISLIGSLIRFAIDVPQVLRRRENLSPDKLLFLLLPIVRSLGKLIDRIRHSSSVVGRNASNGSGRFVPSRGDLRCPHALNAASSSNRIPGPSDNGTAVPVVLAIPSATTPTSAMWQATQQVSAPLNLQRKRQQQQQHGRCSMASMLMSDEDDESSVAFAMERSTPQQPVPRRQVLRQKDGNYAIRETTDMRGADGTFQRITKTISGPDVMILTNITSQLSELPTLLPKAVGLESVRRTEKKINLQPQAEAVPPAYVCPEKTPRKEVSLPNQIDFVRQNTNITSNERTVITLSMCRRLMALFVACTGQNLLSLQILRVVVSHCSHSLTRKFTTIIKSHTVEPLHRFGFRFFRFPDLVLPVPLGLPFERKLIN